jgi:hypothetical protein
MGFLTILAGAQAPAAWSASNPPSINGTWTCCNTGGGTALVWTIQGTGGTVTTSSGDHGNISVTYNYPNVTIDENFPSSGYTEGFTGTVSANGTSMSGTYDTDIGVTGPWTASPLGNRHGVNGTWDCCGATGGADAQDWIINNNGGTGTLAGSQFATLDVSYNWPLISLETIYTGSSYTATFLGVISNDATVMSGTWTSNIGQSGTWVATLASSAPFIGSPGSIPRHDVTPAPIATRLGTPGEVFHNIPHDIANAGIAVAAILFITFPANIFNQTFSTNYDEILLIVGRWRRRARKLIGLKEKDTPVDTPPTPAASATAATDVPSADGVTQETGSPLVTSPAPTVATGRASMPWFAIVLILGAILGGLLNPAFGANGTSLASFLSTLLAFGFGATISWFIAHRFRQWHHYGTTTYLKALPLGLGIAALCVLVSRTSHFQPGYLYGVVVSIAFADTIADRHNAHLTAISILSTMTVAMLAWFAWIPVNHVALEHVTNIPLSVLDDVLGSIFVGGLVGTVVGLLPLVTMPGHTLITWRKDAWAAVMVVAMFLLISVEMRPASGPTHAGGAPWVTVLVLFLLFGGGTFAMRWFFAHRSYTSVTNPPATEVGPTSMVPPVDALVDNGSPDDEPDSVAQT